MQTTVYGASFGSMVKLHRRHFSAPRTTRADAETSSRFTRTSSTALRGDWPPVSRPCRAPCCSAIADSLAPAICAEELSAFVASANDGIRGMKGAAATAPPSPSFIWFSASPL